MTETLPWGPLTVDEERGELRARWSEFLDAVDPNYHPTGVVPRLLATLDAARSESPPPEGLDEDVLYLAQAAEHLTDHLAQEVPTFACEDLDNVQHFAAKIIAAATEQGERT